MNKVIVIAEAGVNHNGHLENAIKLIEIAANAGADYVKFQSFKTEKIVSKNAKKANYQIVNTSSEDDLQFKMLKKLEIPLEWYPILLKHSFDLGVKFLSTGFDEESIDFLYELGVDFFKIPSGEITNKEYLIHIAKKGRPIVLSTGMANINEIGAAIDIFLNEGVLLSDISVLHCSSEYPTPYEDVNLLAMHSIRDSFNLRFGYSDHTNGIEVPIAAVALGASIIEKHFTISREMEGPDHCVSLEPLELKEMIKAIRNIELAISGNGIKEPSLSELNNKLSVRRSLHYKREMKAGEIILKSDLIALRPGDGISPMDSDLLIGNPLKIDVLAYQMANIQDV